MALAGIVFENNFFFYNHKFSRKLITLQIYELFLIPTKFILKNNLKLS